MFALSLNVKQFYLNHGLGATTLGQSAPGSNDNERTLRIHISLALLEPHHQIVLSDIQDIHWWMLSLCKDAGCILHPQPTGLFSFRCCDWVYILNLMKLCVHFSPNLKHPIYSH